MGSEVVIEAKILFGNSPGTRYMETNYSNESLLEQSIKRQSSLKDLVPFQVKSFEVACKAYD
jgi:hypothetical protein